MTVFTISTSRTMIPKKSENQSSIRKTSDAVLRSRLRPVETAFCTASRVYSSVEEVMSVDLPEATDEGDADRVDDKRDQEQQQADREQHVVVDRADRVLPAGCLRDEARHGLHPLARVDREVLLGTCRQGHDHR